MTGTSDTAEGGRPKWVEEVRLGKFEALPKPLDWHQGTKFVYLVSGYHILDFDRLGDLANRTLQRAKNTWIWNGTALDLWLCLFFENRRWRRFGEWPKGRDRILLDDLSEALRRAPLALSPPERQSLVELIAAHPCRWY